MEINASLSASRFGSLLPFKSKITLLAFAWLILFTIVTFAQNIYTARGYWQETTKQTYRDIQEKKEKGMALSAEEFAYEKDYEAFLQTYFNRLSEEEKIRYQQMKGEWDRAQTPAVTATPVVPEEFEFRNRDRGLNYFYGAYYGTSLVVLAEVDNAAAVGIPLITGGLWLLGPALNPKKYDGITQSTIRASNTGKILGLGYGASLGLALAANNDDSGKIIFLLSSVGSIGLGEAAFQIQKRKRTSDGQIEMMRHYGFLGPYVGVSIAAAAQADNANVVGLSLLAGGVSGLLIGNKVSKRYEYSRGDVDVVNSLALISTGIGFTIVAQALDNNSESSGLFLIPAATAVAGTLLAQRSVKNVHLTKKQGSAINLTATGAALIGFGVMAIAQADSPTAFVGVPSLLALIGHQAMFNKFKKENLVKNMQGETGRKKKYEFSMKLSPENYFVNKQMTGKENRNLAVANPMVRLSLRFR